MAKAKLKTLRIGFVPLALLFLLLIVFDRFIPHRRQVIRFFAASVDVPLDGGQTKLQLKNYPDIYVELDGKNLERAGWTRETELFAKIGIYCFLGIFPEAIDFKGLQVNLNEISVEAGDYGLVVDGVDHSVSITKLKLRPVDSAALPLIECL